MALIFTFGDSITYGAWDYESSGWVSRLRLCLDNKKADDPNFYALTYNMGIPGETTDSLARRFLAETTIRASRNSDEELVFIFAYGANDASWIPSQSRFNVDIEKYISNLKTVISEARSLSTKILVLNITPVIEAVAKTPLNKDKSRTNGFVSKYNSELKKLCEGLSIDVIDIFSIFMSHGHEKLFVEDGLHPNSEGHEVIFQEVYKKIMQLLEN